MAQTRNKGRTCRVDDCPRSATSKKMCDPHYRRALKTGEPGDAVIRPKARQGLALPSWRTTHKALRKARGRAAQYPCVDCGKPARDWSYEGGAPDEARDLKNGLTYSSDISYYQPRCSLCHSTYDERDLALRGEGNGRAQLTESDVRQVLSSQESNVALGLRYCVTAETISAIRTGRIWKHVRPEAPRIAIRKESAGRPEKIQSNNTSGVRGVCWSRSANKWRAEVRYNHRRYYVGMFTDLANAEAAVIAKRNELYQPEQP